MVMPGPFRAQFGSFWRKAERPDSRSLDRTSSRASIRHSLRGLAVHETGVGTDNMDDDRAPGSPDGNDTEKGFGECSSPDLRPEQAAVRANVSDESMDLEETKTIEQPGVSGQQAFAERKELATELQDQTNLLPTRQVISVFAGLTAGLFCSLLDQTIVTTALPTLGRVFDRADIASWVGTAYLLTSTAMQPIYGRLSDILGRKIVLLSALGVFLIGSLACAVAQTMIQLIVFRALQGIGGGGVQTLSMIIVSDVVSLQERGKYQGIIGVVVASANSLGPVLGGVFTDRASWRWCFYINLPLTFISIAVITFVLPLRSVKGDIITKLKKLDFWGSLLTLVWATGILLALSWAGAEYAWDSVPVLVPLFVGLVVLGAFIWIEIKLVPLPLIPMRIFKIPTVAAGMLATFLSGCVFYAQLYYLPTYFQVVRGASPIHSGVLLLPLITVQTVCAFASGIITSKTGEYYWILVVGYVLWTIGLALMGSTNEHSSVAMMAGYQVIMGIGAGQTFQTSLIAIQAAVSRTEMATATGTRNALRMLGGTIALAACSAIISNTVQSQLARQDISSRLIRTILSDPTTLEQRGLTDNQKEAVIAAYGISYCFYFFTPLTGVSLLLVIFFVKRISLNRDDDQAKKAEAKAWVESKRQKRQARRQQQHNSPPTASFEKDVDSQRVARQAAASTSGTFNEAQSAPETSADSADRERDPALPR